MGKLLSSLVTGVLFVLKILWWILKSVVHVLGEIIVFFGLYVPGLYLIFGATLSKFTGFDLTIASVDRTLFFWGLFLCLVCSAIITIRKLIIAPFKTAFSNFRSRTKKRVVGSKPQYAPSYDNDKPRRDTNYIAPLVYRSRTYPEITVHEYPDRFELFRDSGDGMGLKYFKTEYKNNFK